MYTSIAKRLALTPTDYYPGWWQQLTDPPAVEFQHSQPVSMEGYNAVMYDATVFEYSSGGSLSPAGEFYIDLQGSNDLENWETIVDSYATVNGIIVSGEGHSESAFATDVSFAYVRLQVRCYQPRTEFNADAAYSVLDAGINTTTE